MAQTRIVTLDLNFQGRPHAIASYLIRQGDAVVLIESGPGSTLSSLEAGLAKGGLSPHDVTHVLLTHIHLDHAGAAGWLALQGAEIWVHPIGAPHMVHPEKLIASATRIYGDRMESLWGEFLPVPTNHLKVAQDREAIRIGSTDFIPLHTPGHAEHDFSYLFEDIVLLVAMWAVCAFQAINICASRCRRLNCTQRDSRGTLVDWAFSSFEGISGAARLNLYEHAHSYIDGLLDVIMSTHGDLGGQVPELEEVVVPSFCVAGSVKSCAAALLTMQHNDLPASIESYRKKALFASTVGEQWDDIQDLRAKAYMTCRAAIAAKDDFDMTPEDKLPGTTEDRRRGRDCFRVDATVGMD